MRLDPTQDYGDNYWVAHPGGAETEEQRFLADHRYELEIVGVIHDEEASYSYDDWALVRLGRKYWLLATRGCSCPSPTETWRIEVGPTTLAKVEAHVRSGDYDGYTVPGRQLRDFLDVFDEERKRTRRTPTKGGEG